MTTALQEGEFLEGFAISRAPRFSSAPFHPGCSDGKGLS